MLKNIVPCISAMAAHLTGGYVKKHALARFNEQALPQIQGGGGTGEESLPQGGHKVAEMIEPALLRE